MSVGQWNHNYKNKKKDERGEGTEPTILQSTKTEWTLRKRGESCIMRGVGKKRRQCLLPAGKEKKETCRKKGKKKKVTGWISGELEPTKEKEKKKGEGRKKEKK